MAKGHPKGSRVADAGQAAEQVVKKVMKNGENNQFCGAKWLTMGTQWIKME